MWFKEVVFYEIYLPSFKDSNRDGVGDFGGIISKLDYLKELGIGGLWITPFYKSPKVDNGYDIEDYYVIDRSFGTMKDFENLLKEAHRRGIKVIVDLVLNHTSNKHKWFSESKKSIENPFRDFYIWRKEKPNNWESFFAGSAWEFDNTTNEYYYHAFSKEQVCLNWSNSDVKKEMFKVMEFWLNKGIDGFRFDVINFLKVNMDLFDKDNPVNNDSIQEHIYDKDQIGIIETIKEITQFIRNWDDKFLVGEVGSEDVEVLRKYLGEDLLDVVFNFNIGSINSLNAAKIINELKKMNEFVFLPTLFFSSHDMSRYMSRLCNNNKKLAKVIAGLMLMAKGVPFIYQGDEIGMTDFTAKSKEDIKDIQAILTYNELIESNLNEEESLIKANERCRDKSRSPMQWDKTMNYYGFSKDKPWLSINENLIDVKSQFTNKRSMYNIYKTLINLRNNYKVLQYGEYIDLKNQGEVISFIREYNGEKILVILNFGNNQYDFNYKNEKLLFSTIEKRSNIIEPYELSIYMLY